MAQPLKRADTGDVQDKRKSGMFFFNNRFKRSSSTKTHGDGPGSGSTPSTPIFGSHKGNGSTRSIPLLNGTAAVSPDAERPTTPEAVVNGDSKALVESPKAAEAAKEDKPDTESTIEAPTTTEHEVTAEAEEIAPGVEATETQPSAEPAKGETTESEADSGAQDDEATTDTADTEVTAPLAALVNNATPEADKTISYHADANLHINVREADGTSAVYSVCTGVLTAASRVWRDTLASNTSGVVDMLSPSDTPRGLDILFSLAHYKFHDLAETLQADEIYDLAVTADKYEVTHLLVPFLREWIAGLAGAPSDDEKTLVSSWVFGEARTFSKAISKIAYSSFIGPDGALVDSNGRPWADQPVPPEVLDIILATRAEAIENIIKAISTPVYKLLDPQGYPGEEIRCCLASDDDLNREECEQLQLGSVIMGLTKARFWPPPQPSKITMSAADLAKAYGMIKMRRYQEPGLRLKDDESAVDAHAQCGFGQREAFERVLSTPAKLTTSVVKLLETRAKKSGIYSDELFEDLKELLDAGADTEDLKSSAVYYKQTTAKKSGVLENEA